MELSPDAGHSKYMYLGQIHTGQEAVDHYTRGIQVLLSDLSKDMPVSACAVPHRHCHLMLHGITGIVTRVLLSTILCTRGSCWTMCEDCLIVLLHVSPVVPRVQ